MSKKMLYILNVANRVNNFSYASMIAAQNLGIEYHIAGNWGYSSDEERKKDEKRYGIRIYQIDFIRAPYHPGNIKAYRQLDKIIKDEQYDLIHCNTPIGGVVGRLLGKKNRISKVIYQAHGFHFYKGAPIFNWLVYYPIERVLARYTDVLITINNEDYQRAKKFKAKEVSYVPGVGIDLDKFNIGRVDKEKKRNEIRVKSEAFLLLSIGELVPNKNHEVVIRAMSILKKENRLGSIEYAICGKGYYDKKLRKLVKELDLENRVHFLGYRNDIYEICNSADLFVFMSHREGLPVSLMEAMACGLPVICSNIRGNTDLIEDNVTGLISNNIPEELAEKIDKMKNNSLLRKNVVKAAEKRIKDFDIRAIEKVMRQIYEKELYN